MGNTQHKDALSALIDGELAYDDAVQQLHALDQQPDALALIGRYQRYGAVLRGGVPAINYDTLFASIHARIASEPTVLAPRAVQTQAKSSLWRGALSGGAIAASLVAALFVGVVNLQSGAPLSDSPLVVEATSPAVIDATDPVLQDQHHLRSYLKQHENLLAADGLNGGLPLAFMVGYNGF